MEILLTNAYPCLGQKSKVLETNSVATGTEELFQRKIYAKKRHFFTKWHFEMFINGMNGGHKMISKLSYEN